MDFRLLDPNAAARGVGQANQWADAYATRRAGRALADGDGIGATDILNRNGLMDQAQGVLDNEWKAQDREIAARTRAEQEAQRAEERRLAEEAREAQVLGNMASNLRGVLTSRGAEAVLPAFDVMAGTWVARGADPEQIAQMRAGLEADPDSFLTAVVGASDQALERYKFFQNGGSIFRADQLTGDAREVARGDRYEAVDPTRDFIRIPGMSSDGPSDAAGSRPDVRPADAPEASEAPPATGEGLLAAMVPITAQAESRNRERDGQGRLIRSSAGAEGRMQVMPGTRVDPGFGVRPAQDDSDEERSRVGRDYLGAMMARYGNDPAKAWAAYNWGPGNLDNALQRHGDNWLAHAPAETKAYVASNVRALGTGGATPAPRTQDPPAAMPGGVEVIRPGRARPSAQYRAATAEELAGYPAGTAAQVDTTTGQLTNIRTPPAARSGGGAAGGQRGGRLPPAEDVQLRTWRTEAGQAAAAANIYRQMLPLARTVDTGGMMAMPGAGTVRGAFDADTRRFMALTDQLTPAMRQGLPGAASDRDVAMFRGAAPSIDKPREANIAAAEAGLAWGQRQGDFVAFMENYSLENGTIRGGMEEWARYTADQPLFDAGAHNMPRVRRVIPWRQWFRTNGSGSGAAAPAPRTQAPPRTGGTPLRRRYNPSTGGFD